MTLPSPTGSWFGILLFLLIAITGLALFGVRAGELITLLAKARREDRTDHIDDRIGQFFLVVLGQSGVLRDPIPGIAHFFTFWGFIIISIALLNLMLQDAEQLSIRCVHCPNNIKNRRPFSTNIAHQL